MAGLDFAGIPGATFAKGFLAPFPNSSLVNRLALLTDLYQLTMMCGYHGRGKLTQRSCFDLYFRKLPFGGGFCLACGLEPALEYLTGLSFEPEDIAYLRSLGIFNEEFLEWLSRFRFEGDVWALPEGTPVFPDEPILRVEADLPQAQLVESALLNIMNFQTLAATKAARVCQAAGEGTVLEFGLRRAQGIDGALSASRAAFVGGCHATSNALAGKMYGIPVRGTHAHSWVMSFDSELEAFRAYAESFPDSCTLLVDTYDTLESGVPNAVKVGHELRERGHTLRGIRLDSGDMAALSIGARRQLDEAGLTETRIVASNDLDEHSILSLKSRGARIDIWGVGTNLVTCKDEPALGGVYKLVAASDKSGRMTPRIKISANPGKSTFPGRKQLYRVRDQEGRMLGDVLALEDEDVSGDTISTAHPHGGGMRDLGGASVEPLLRQVLREGERVKDSESLAISRERGQSQLALLSEEHRKLHCEKPYWVGLSPQLQGLRDSMMKN